MNTVNGSISIKSNGQSPSAEPTRVPETRPFSKTGWLRTSWHRHVALINAAAVPERLKSRKKTPQKHNQTTRLTIMRTAEPWSFVSAAAGQGGNELPWWLWVCCLLDWCLMRACLMLSVTERRLRTVCGERKGMTQRASNRDGQKRRLERWRYVNEEREWEK